MIPHERSLVEKLAGKPFALVGVNSDSFKDDEMQKKLKEYKVTWRSFKNKQKSNTIADDFAIQGWPTLILIDHKGVVRKKWVGSPGNEKLDEEVQKLVDAAAKDLK
ncbi:MAG: TlpA disulfide reductase family protein [Gemmataceae bacterium]